jgi:hypothetical protein
MSVTFGSIFISLLLFLHSFSKNKEKKKKERERGKKEDIYGWCKDINQVVYTRL